MDGSAPKGQAIQVLVMNTLAFTVCFAAWMMNGVLVTFLVDNQVFEFSKVQIGWLIGTPVLTGAITRLPVGLLTDKYGGRVVYTVLMLISAIPMWLMSTANTYGEFLLFSLGFGLTGASFAVGIAYTSVWFERSRQGTALGIFGAGNAGAALTSLGAPTLLGYLTAGSVGMEGWRSLPKIYAAALATTAVIFWFMTHTKKLVDADSKTMRERLKPLGEMRVWRFGLYYFFVFGGFVALAQWLIPYYVNVYAMSVVTAGLMASIFSLPSGVIRALGGWLSDLLGARSVMYWVLAVSAACCLFLTVPRMDIAAPGQGVMAPASGTITAVSAESVTIGNRTLPLQTMPPDSVSLINDPDVLILPAFEFWQEPVVVTGQEVKKKELLARGVTHIYFQANVWIFTALVFALGIAMGIGKAAVYKHIPDYFPHDVGVVGGIVGVLGGLGGFVCPIIFGYLLQGTGIWTTCWLFFLALTVGCLIWMHLVVRRMLKARDPELLRHMEHTTAEFEESGDAPEASDGAPVLTRLGGGTA